MQIWPRTARIFGFPGILFAGLAVWGVLEVFHTAAYAAELLERIPEAVDEHAGWTVFLSALLVALVIGWPDLKKKYPWLRLLPRSLDEEFRELNRVVMKPETGHCDRIKAAEEKLALTALLTDVAKRDTELGMAFSSSTQDISNAMISRFAKIEESIAEVKQHVRTVEVTLMNETQATHTQIGNLRKQVNDLGANGAHRIAEIATRINGLEERLSSS